MRPVPSPHRRTGLVKTGSTIDKGRRMALEAQAWMEGSEDAFRAVHGFLKRLQADGRRGRIRDRVATFCADNGIKVGEHGFRNGFWAALVRYLALYDPTLMDGVLEMNDSYIDCYGLLPVSWMPEIGESDESDGSPGGRA